MCVRPDWPEGVESKWIQMGECRSTRKDYLSTSQPKKTEERSQIYTMKALSKIWISWESLRVADNQFLVCVFYSFISGSRQTFFQPKGFPFFNIKYTVFAVAHRMYGTRCWPGVVQGIHCVLSWENLKVFDIKSQASLITMSHFEAWYDISGIGSSAFIVHLYPWRNRRADPSDPFSQT